MSFTTKLTLNQWVMKSIPYDSSYYIKDALNEMFDHIINLVNRYDELQFDYGQETMKHKFYSFMHTTYYLKEETTFTPYCEEMYEYFGLKFSEDCIDLFFKFKEITKQYNIFLLQGPTDTSLSIQEFLFDTLLVADPYEDSCDESGEENNLDIHIDEHEL